MAWPAVGSMERPKISIIPKGRKSGLHGVLSFGGRQWKSFSYSCLIVDISTFARSKNRDSILFDLELEPTDSTLKPSQHSLLNPPLIDKALKASFLHSLDSITRFPRRTLGTNQWRKFLHRHSLTCQPQCRQCCKRCWKRWPVGTSAV